MDMNSNRDSSRNDDVRSPSYKPRNYKEMDEWLNVFSYREWTAILGSYAAGGFANVVEHMRDRYADNLEKWREKDLRHFFNSRQWSDFKGRSERMFA